MNARRKLALLIDRLTETVRIVRARIRDAVAAEIGQAVGSTAHELLHDLLRGAGPRVRTAELRTRDPDDPEAAGDSVADRSDEPDRPAIDDRIDPPPAPRIPTWLGLGLGLAAGLAALLSGPHAAAGAMGSAADWIALARWALGHSPF
jgi:hypothetical protein